MPTIVCTIPDQWPTDRTSFRRLCRATFVGVHKVVQRKQKHCALDPLALELAAGKPDPGDPEPERYQDTRKGQPDDPDARRRQCLPQLVQRRAGRV